MRKTISALTLALAVVLASVTLIPIAVYANDDDNSPIAITVVIPREEVRGAEVSDPNPHNIYPVQVWESREDGRRQIIRVYELNENENPAHIPRGAFERDGFRFELAEIVRREIPAHSVIDHAETIEIITQTNDLASVIRLLSPTIDYLREDGYFGVLTLDISTIEIVSQGTTSSNFTATQTREYPHLSSPDTSLVPRTINHGGRTYNLVNVEWRSQSTTAVDFTQVASTFTAVATYSRVGTRTSTIGYTTTAVYRGQISRIAVGRTEFTASFVGIPIVTPIITQNPPTQANTETATPTPTPLPVPTTIENITVEQVHVGGIVIETEQVMANPTDDVEDNAAVADDEIENSDSDGSLLRYVIIGLLFVGGMVIAFFAGKKGKAMLAGMRKVSCFIAALLMIGGIMLGTSQAVYAAELPRYGFGNQNRQNAENSTHFNESPPNSAAYTQTTESAAQQNANAVIHFNPSTAASDGIAVRASPARHFSTESGNTHGYIYGNRIGVLTVERLNRTVNVIAGATMEAMDFGGGHFSFTGLNSGNTGIIGHNRGRTGYFSFVRNLHKGDIITLEADGITRSYAVSMTFIIGDNDFSPLMEFGDNRLTLITCVEYQSNQRRIAVALALD